jgi:multiple sugar transport system ATP-binding protein
MSGLSLRNVGKSYGAVTVMKDLNLDIHDGEFLVLVGPSGCGKSTLLRMIAGLEDISTGTISIGDRIVNDLPASQRKLSMVFQSYALYPHMSVKKNLAFGLQNLKMSKAEIERRVADAARILQIEPLLERKPRQLSGGQKQRVAIGRAIVREPELFLFDEPLSNLDAELRVQMRVELAGLYNRLGTTMIYVTHDQVEAMTMASRIVVLRAGKIEQVGTPYELYTSPCNLFVAGFIGSPKINLIEGMARHQAGQTLLDLADFGAIKVPGLATGTGKLTMGIRPEAMHLGHGPVQALAKVQLVEYLGSEIFVHVALASGAVYLVHAAGKARHFVGEEVSVTFDPVEAHYFNEAGLRVEAMAEENAA